MRLARLDLRAFGPFTNVSLDFSGGAPGGLHVIYGPNEAGKSSALRAVRDLLYGFEHRTPDAHLHATDELCVGGMLEGTEGALYVQRVKRRKDSLFDASGAPLDEALVKRLLGGIDRDTFARSFGLGHAELEAQGERMLRGEASVGETLFDAGTGGVDVRHLISTLEAEQDKLYRPRSKQEVTRLLDQYAEARRRSQELWLLPETFQKQTDELEAARSELARAVERIGSLRTEQHRLRDLKKALPALERRAECLREIAELGHVVSIPEATSERRERAEGRATAARAAVARLEAESERSERRLAELEVPEALLAIGQNRVARLADAPGRTRKARDDLPRREADLRALEAQARASLAELGRPGEALSGDTAALSTDARTRIHALATERNKLDDRLVTARERRSELQREIDERCARLARLPEPAGREALERVAALSRSLGDVESPLHALERRHAELLRAAEQRCTELNPPVAGLEALARLRVPAVETLTRFADDAAELARRTALVDDEARRIAERAAETRAAVLRIEASGEIPTETELTLARAERDAAVGAVIDAWRSGDVFGVREAERVAERTGRADLLADRLRREAGRVAELVHARAEAELVREREANVALQRAQIAETSAAQRSAYGEAWRDAPFTPLPPAEMRAWLDKRRRVLELVEEARALERDLASKQADRARLEGAVVSALGPLSEHETLLAAVERAVALGAERARLANEREELLRTLDVLHARMAHEVREQAAAEEALGAWRAAWARAMEPLGAEPELSPVTALELLEELTKLAGILKERDALARRIKGIRRDEAELASEVSELAAAHGIKFDPAAPDAAAEEIVARFRRAEAARAERERLASEATERNALLGTERAALADAERELSGLAAEFGARTPAELPVLEAKSRRARELAARLADLEATLVDDSGGRSVATLVAEATGKDAPVLAARLEELGREIEDLEEERARALDRAASLQAGQRRQSDADGAEAAQEEQTLAAALSARIERYATLRVATALLERAIERYRLENQGPILKRAGELFPRLTGDAFTTLRVAREGGRIVAVRPDGSELLPNALSEGTRYQLYLALRLASVERFVQGAEPLPLVLDDATIHFDEARKRRTFAVLSELAERVQILFFTHHQEDKRLALESGSGEIDEREASSGEAKKIRVFAHDLVPPGRSRLYALG
jgi:uncharacterized protein YhaN